jgi:hypothetical protein
MEIQRPNQRNKGNPYMKLNFQSDLYIDLRDIADQQDKSIASLIIEVLENYTASTLSKENHPCQKATSHKK